MSEHTPGSVRYDYEPGYCGELIASNGTSIATFTDEPSEANARRLVAAWNACDGVSTIDLEMDNVQFIAVFKQRNELRAQRDELLAALETAEALLLSMGMQSSDAYQEICAAIAKAEGSKVGDAS